MAERPLLLLAKAMPAARGKKGGGGEGPKMLSAARQQERLGPRLQELEQAFESKRVQLQTAATGIFPEDVLVLETAGKLDEFVKAVRRIEGFEFLAEYDQQNILPDEDFYVEKNDAHVAYTGRVYLVFSNQKAFQQLLRLWKVFQDGGKFDIGYTKWRDVFGFLRDIRPWGVKDRLEETGVLADWEERVQQRRENIHCEIELWFHTDESKRQAASNAIKARVQDLEGAVLREGIVPGIQYHGLAVRLPIQVVQQILNPETRSQVQLVHSEQVQFFRAAGQMMADRVPDEKTSSDTGYAGPLPTGPARVALFDGLPLQNHSALRDRLQVDDPDSFETDYPAEARNHGTAMASLIIWGDLNEPIGSSIPQPLYVRPIMRPVYPPEWTEREPEERIPEGILAVDLLYRSVRRLFEPEGNADPMAPNVSPVNFSEVVAST